MRRASGVRSRGTRYTAQAVRETGTHAVSYSLRAVAAAARPAAEARCMSSSHASSSKRPAASWSAARPGACLPLAVRRLDRTVLGLELFERAGCQAVAAMDRRHRCVRLDDQRTVFPFLDNDVLAGAIAAESDVDRAFRRSWQTVWQAVVALRDGSVMEARGAEIITEAPLVTTSHVLRRTGPPPAQLLAAQAKPVSTAARLVIKRSSAGVEEEDADATTLEVSVIRALP